MMIKKTVKAKTSINLNLDRSKLKLREDRALGLDVSNESISVAVLKRHKNQLRLIHAERRAMPEGLLKAGVVDNPKMLRQILNEYKRKFWGTRLTTLSLFSPRSLIQILDVPNTGAMSMGAYIQKEIKHYVNLAGIKTVSDYRHVDSTSGNKRMFVAASDVKCVSSVVNTCESVGLDVQGVELALLSYIRALYQKKIAKGFNCNVVMAIIRDGQVILAVLRDRNLDFVSCHSIAKFNGDADKIAEHIEKKIKIVMQYYEVEVAEGSGEWSIHLVSDEAHTWLDQVMGHMSEVMGEIPVEKISSEKIADACSVEISSKVSKDQISMAAVGSAMYALSEDIPLPKVNLLPVQIKEVKEVRKGMLITAIAASMLLFLMGLTVMALTVKANDVQKRIYRKQPLSHVGDVVKVRSDLESQIELVGKIPTVMKEKIQQEKVVNWAGFLSDINEVKPDGICLTQLETRKDLGVVIIGQALTYRDVTGFVASLGEAEDVVSVELNKTDQKREGDINHYVYEINCQLKADVGI